LEPPAIERATRKLLAGRGVDFDKTDWRDVAVYHWSRTQCGIDERGAMMLPASGRRATGRPAISGRRVDVPGLGRLTPIVWGPSRMT